MTLDLDALKARLSEYDDTLPRCLKKVARKSNCAPDHLTSKDESYHDYDFTTHSPCIRPEGHEGDCRNSRFILGWPGFVTVSALVAEVERLRELLLNAGWPREADGIAELALQAERAAVVAWLRGSDDDLVADYGDDIERGEHRREEKP
jgi:hypothetical protein